MKTALSELDSYVEDEPLIDDLSRRLIKKKVKELLEVEKDQITYAWAAGHRVAIRNPKHNTSPDEYYEDQFD